MRHTIGGTWIMQLMILFILLFVGFIILTLNYSKTVRVKNEMISMIEKYEGLNEQSVKLVNDFLLASGYAGMGQCNANNDPGVYGSNDLSTTYLEKAESGTRYHYCVKKYKGANISYYYQVTIFYKFNLPIFGNTGSYVVKGTTTNFQPNDDSNYAQSVDGNFETSNGGGYDIGSYVVTFNLNGAMGSIPSQYVSAGSRATKPADPTREGYTFKGWQLNGKDYNFNSLVVNNIILVAKWTKNTTSGSGGGSTPTSRVPSRDEIMGFTLWKDKYWVCDNPRYTAKNCLGSVSLRSEYANNWSYYTEVLLEDYQTAYGITFTDEEKQQFRKNWAK